MDALAAIRPLPQIAPRAESAARELAIRLLGHDPVRLAHVQGAAAHAARVAAALPSVDVTELVCAAMVHDIGYNPGLAVTGFHPVDGAAHLRSLGWPVPIVSLVAYHSQAYMTAPYYGASDALAEFPAVPGLAADALTYADVSSGRDGRGATPQQRIEDMRQRHGYDSRVPTQVRELRYRRLLTAAHRITLAMGDNRPAGRSRWAAPVCELDEP